MLAGPRGRRELRQHPIQLDADLYPKVGVPHPGAFGVGLTGAFGAGLLPI